MSTTAEKNKPLAWVAWIRLVAVLGVISIHNAGSNATAAAKGDLRKANLLGVALDLPFLVCVPIFVMVSGTLALNPAKFQATGSFLRKRVVRLLPAIIFWNLAYIVFLQLWFNPELPADDILRRFLTAKTAPHLYFLWIVLGLSFVTPLLLRWVKEASPREQLWTGAAFAALPALSAATRAVRGNAVIMLETPWTWWFGYLGLYLLGWALRDVVLTGWRLALTAAVGVALPVLFCFQFTFKAQYEALNTYAPVSYYSATVIVASVALFVTARSTIREGGLLSFLTGRHIMSVVNPLAMATMGIYAFHMIVLFSLVKLEVFGPAATSGPLLVLRLVAATIITLIVVMLARRVPVVRQVF